MRGTNIRWSKVKRNIVGGTKKSKNKTAKSKRQNQTSKIKKQKNKTIKQRQSTPLKKKSQIYTNDGEIIDTDETINGHPFFRKMTNNINELEICKIIMDSPPHENIVKIYNIKPGIDSYYDMDLLDTNLQAFSLDQIKETMKYVKDYLQNLGIAYIDWKPDNIGVGLDGKLKLFDFDTSGLMEKDTDKWKQGYEPRKFWSYSKAVEAGAVVPKEIDDYAFEIGFERPLT